MSKAIVTTRDPQPPAYLEELGPRKLYQPLRNLGCSWVTDEGIWPCFTGALASNNGVLCRWEDDPLVPSGELQGMMPAMNRWQVEQAAKLPGFDKLERYTFHEVDLTSAQIRSINAGGRFDHLIRPASRQTATHALKEQLRRDSSAIKRDLAATGRQVAQAGKASLPFLGAAALGTVLIGGLILCAPLIAVAALASADPAIFAALRVDDSGYGYFVCLTRWNSPMVPNVQQRLR